MKILVRNLDRSTTQDELQSLFEAFGSVQSCNIVTDQKTNASKGFAFVEMPKPGEAKAAIKSLNNHALGNAQIRVKKAQETTE